MHRHGGLKALCVLENVFLCKGMGVLRDWHRMGGSVCVILCLSVCQVKTSESLFWGPTLEFHVGGTWHNSGGFVCLFLCLSVDLPVCLSGHSSIGAGMGVLRDCVSQKLDFCAQPWGF